MISMNSIIRRARPEDAARLSDLSCRTFYDTFTGTCTEEDMQGFLKAYFNIEVTLAQLNDPDDYYYFIEVDGVAAGYIRIKEDYSGFEMIQQWKALELKRIYVDKPYQGLGIAQQLIQFIEDFARQHSFEVIFLGVWEHNHRAKRFYEKMGFQDSGHMHDFPIGTTPQRDNWLWKFLL